MRERNNALPALLLLLCAAGEPPPAPTPAVPWPTLQLAPSRPATPPGWPISSAEIGADPFTAVAEQPPLLLPLRRCGIADCLRPATDAEMAAPVDAAPTLVQLLTPFPVDRPIDRRHAIAALVTAAICTFLWRHRTRRARGGY